MSEIGGVETAILDARSPESPILTVALVENAISNRAVEESEPFKDDPVRSSESHATSLTTVKPLIRETSARGILIRSAFFGSELCNPLRTVRSLRLVSASPSRLIPRSR